MKVDIVFAFAKVYDISKVDIELGQKFSLIGDKGEKGTIWFSSNDKVLDIDVVENTAVVLAASSGSSIILVANSNLVIVKRIDITVNDTKAASLGLTYDFTERKF